MSAIEGAFMRLRSTGKKVPRSLSPKALSKTEGRFLRFIFNNKGTAGEDCRICKPLDGHVWEVLDKNRPIIPRLEPSKRSISGRSFTHPNCECRWAEVFADEAYAYEVTREEWENSTIQGKQQQLELVGGPIEMAIRSWATLPFALRQRLETLTANTNQASLFSTKFDEKNINNSLGNEKSMSWNEATVNQKFTILLDSGVPFQEAHFASKLRADEAAVVLGADGNSSTELLNMLLQGNIPNTKFMIDVQTPDTKGFHPGGVEFKQPLPLEPDDNDPAGRDEPTGLMEQGDDPQVLEPTQSPEICPDDLVLKNGDCVPPDSDLVLTEMYEKAITYEQANNPLPLEPEDDDPSGRDEPIGLAKNPDRGDGLNTGKKNLEEQTDDDEDEDEFDPITGKGTPDTIKRLRKKADAEPDEDSDETLNDDKKDLTESALTRYFRNKIMATELPPCEPGSLLNPDSGECEEVADIDDGVGGTITEPSGTDETPLTIKGAAQLGDPTDILDVPNDPFPEETGMDIGLDEEQVGVMDGNDECGPGQIMDSRGNCVQKQAEQADSDDGTGDTTPGGFPNIRDEDDEDADEQADNDNLTETWATEADLCRCGEKAWNSAYEVYGANIPAIILNKLPDDMGTYLLTNTKRRRLAGLEFKDLPPEIRAGAMNLLQKYPAIIKKKR